jgi:uncharacterized protein DUF4160
LRPACIAQLIQVELLRRRLRLAQIQGVFLPNSLPFNQIRYNPPHFHAHYGDYSAVFSIDKLEMIRGSLPPRVKGLVIEWADLHKSELQKNWELLKIGKHNKIKPLV